MNMVILSPSSELPGVSDLPVLFPRLLNEDYAVAAQGRFSRSSNPWHWENQAALLHYGRSVSPLGKCLLPLGK